MLLPLNPRNRAVGRGGPGAWQCRPDANCPRQGRAPPPPPASQAAPRPPRCGPRAGAGGAGPGPAGSRQPGTSPPGTWRRGGGGLICMFAYVNENICIAAFYLPLLPSGHSLLPPTPSGSGCLPPTYEMPFSLLQPLSWARGQTLGGQSQALGGTVPTDTPGGHRRSRGHVLQCLTLPMPSPGASGFHHRGP